MPQSKLGALYNSKPVRPGTILLWIAGTYFTSYTRKECVEKKNKQNKNKTKILYL